MFSVTRLTGTNYETQAAAATDLGGIEVSRSRLVITIGLSTITYNPTVTPIIIAAGEAKFQVVHDAVEEKKHQQFPASALHDVSAARFYITKGIAGLLSERRIVDVQVAEAPSEEFADETAIAIACSLCKPLHELSREDFENDPLGREVLLKTGADHHRLAAAARDRIVAKITKGLSPISKETFLHTEPHQDDVMLSYISYIYHLVRDPTNKHNFANLTSGFTSVSNHYFLSIVRKLRAYLESSGFLKLYKEGYFGRTDATSRMEDVYLFLDGSAGRCAEKKDEARRGA